MKKIWSYLARDVIKGNKLMQKFDIKLDEKGKVLIPKVVMNSFRGKKLVLVVDESQIRIMPKAMYKNLEVA